MYLSKVILKWPFCRNPYRWHRLIWRLFPDREEENRDYQFAVLKRRKGSNITILLLSKEKPKQVHTPEIELTEESKSLNGLSFTQGQMLRFRLTANPAKVLTEASEEKRKIRVPFIKPEQQITWLKRKLDGFADVESAVTRNELPIYFNRKGKGGKIVPVTFEGVLKVTEPEEFKEQIYEKYEDQKYIAGIGPAKAFGCGLMLVKRI
jgi:CRISPR system Cascade subunit CasE